jgi:hypothetical protein
VLHEVRSIRTKCRPGGVRRGFIPTCIECNSLRLGERDGAPELMRGKPAGRLNARQTLMSLAHRSLVLATQFQNIPSPLPTMQ